MYIVYCLLYRSIIFHSYRDINIAGEGLQHLAIWTPLKAFGQDGIFTSNTYYDTGPWFISEEPPVWFLIGQTKGIEDLFVHGSSCVYYKYFDF